MRGHPPPQPPFKAPKPPPERPLGKEGATPTQQGSSAETSSDRTPVSPAPWGPSPRALPVPLEMPILAAAPTETRTDPGAAEKYVLSDLQENKVGKEGREL